MRFLAKATWAILSGALACVTATCMSLDPEEPSLVNVCGIAVARDSEALDLTGEYLRERDFRAIPELEQLEYLDLSATNVDDSSLTWIGKCPSLRELILNDTKVTASGLAKLQYRSIKFLGLMDTSLGQGARDVLGEFSALDGIHFDGSDIDEPAVAALLSQQSINEVSVARTSVSDSLGKSIRESRVVSLDLSETHVTDAIWEDIAAAPCLRSVRLGGTAVSLSGLGGMTFPAIAHLDISRTRALSFSALSQFPHLKSLTAAEMPFEIVTTDALALLSDLEDCDLAYNTFADDSMSGLVSCRLLTSLDISFCQLQRSAILRLAEMPALKRIVAYGLQKFAVEVQRAREKGIEIVGCDSPEQ